MDDLFTSKTLALRMAIVWFCLFTVVSLCTSIITALYQLRWEVLDLQDKLMVGLLVLANWGTVMMAFLSKAMSRVQHGEFPIESGDTQLLQRTEKMKQVTSSEVTLQTPPKTDVETPKT